jgi:ABC-type Mn2+/Zn2+ transport system permease subunit
VNAWLRSCFDGVQADLMTIALVIGLLLTLWILWRVQRAANRVDLVDIIVGDDGKASWTKLTAVGAFLISSWGFVALIQRDKMTETLFGLYIAVYSGAPVAYRFIASRSPLTDKPEGATA